MPKEFILRSKHWAVLKFIDWYQKEYSCAPTIREITEPVKTTSTSVAWYWIEPLIVHGYLDRMILPTGQMAPRSLYLTDYGMEMLAEHYEREEVSRNG